MTALFLLGFILPNLCYSVKLKCCSQILGAGFDVMQQPLSDGAENTEQPLVFFDLETTGLGKMLNSFSFTF